MGQGQLDILLSTVVSDLLPDETGTVIGCRVQDAHGTHDIEADAVILATGGYAANLELMNRFHSSAGPILSRGPPVGSGLGLELAERAGADVVN